MESKITSSFIPDQMPGSAPKGSSVSRAANGGVDILVVIAIVIFAATVALSAGVFLYDKYLTANSAAKSEQLQRERKLLEPATVRVLMRLDKRLSAASAVLSAHTAPTSLYTLLEDLTLESVYFKNLDYSSSKDGNITIKMQGKAQSVNGVALQADVFGKNRAIINPIFSNLNLVVDGVEFEVTTEVDRKALKYTAETAGNKSNSQDVNF